MRLAVAGVGLVAPGLQTWQAAIPVLRGDEPYRETELILEKPQRLPRNERRRATRLIRLSFQAAEQAVAACASAPRELATVFGSSGGDTRVIHQICSALATPERAVSPTQFHNSVHNAAAGYWSIATGASGPSTCLCAFDDTVAASLLEAGAMVAEEHLPVLCVVCDQRPDPPLFAKRPTVADLGAALVLLPVADNDEPALPTLSVTTTDAEPTALHDLGLEGLRAGIPAGRILPVLQVLALRAAGEVVLCAPGRNIVVSIEPA